MSQLLSRRVCPNFVDTFEVWCGPAPSGWDAAFEDGLNYQFVRMELCNGGNLEDHLKSMPNQVCRSTVMVVHFSEMGPDNVTVMIFVTTVEWDQIMLL